MKKILSILCAGLVGLMAASCVPEPKATFDPADSTAPVMGATEVGAKAVSVDFTPAVFNLGFNEKLTPNHTLALVSINGETVSKIVSSSVEGSTLSATLVSISKALATFGYKDGDNVSSVQLAVRATLQNLSQDNGVNGFLDSEGRLSLDNFTVTLPVGSPYADYTEATTWSVIGALSNYDISWNGDIEMFATKDGDKFVAKAVTIKKDDQFKFRKDAAWDENYGAPGDTEPFVVSLDSEFSGAAGGKNLAVPADGVYDLWLDLSGSEAKITVTEAFFAYPSHKEASTWSVIGALSNYGINWNGDLAMITDGTTHVAQGIKITKDDQFKFRKDAAWDTNFGATGETEPFVVSLDSETPAAAGGKNLAVPADGIYDLILNPDSQTYTIVETLGGGVSNKIAVPEPPQQEDTWGLIGIGGDWENDLVMAENDGVWSIITTIAATDTWKIRKNASWDENYGGPGEDNVYVLTLDTPITGVAGGKNLAVPADGTYMVTFDATTLEISVSEADIWSLIGDFNSWGGDVDMVLTDGKWVSPATHLSGGFKIRHNHDWTLSVGGTMTAIGEAFDAISTDGPNISVEEGDYIVTYDPEAQKIVVDLAKTANCWSVIGAFNGWADDAYMTQVAPGIWISEELELTADGWKIRFDNNWDINRGGATPTQVGEFVAAYPGGDDIKFGGKARVVFNENNQTIGTLGWGVTGSIAALPNINWSNDVPMNLAADGKWYSAPVTLAEGDKIKIRWMGGWDDNRGGDFVAADEAFAVTNGGNDIAVPAGTFMVVYDPTAETITLSTDFWSLIGEFNSWSGDRFMLPLGEGKWAAYNQEISGGWKIRKSADWTISAGGTYAAAGTAFDAVTAEGPNIAVTDMTRFDVLYDTAAGQITVTAPVK